MLPPTDRSATMDVGVFGQQPGIQIYTQITYIFATPDDSSGFRARIADTLARGLDRLGAAFPWLAGQVVKDAGTGRYRFAPRAQPAPDLRVVDLRSYTDAILSPAERAAQHPPELSFDALAAAGFPFAMLDEARVASRRTFPGHADEAHLAEQHVFMVQAGFVPGGLLLTVTAHHAAMDMAGQGAVVQWLSRACRGEDFTEEELRVGNSKRMSVVPLLGPDEGGDDPFVLIPEQVVQPAEKTEKSESAAPPPTSVWAYFDFSAASLAALKTEASATLPAAAAAAGDAPAFVSTNDAYTAFVWQAVVRARLPRLADMEKTPSTLARAVDMRRFLGVPPAFPGLLQNMTIHTLPSAQHVAAAPLGALAARLRGAMAADRLVARTRALATCLERFPAAAAARVSFVGAVDAGAGGLMLSSWASVPAFASDMDFGLGLGVARAVRRPAFTPVEGLAYLMPAAADGSIAAALCLREEDLARLRGDPVFTKHGHYIG